MRKTARTPRVAVTLSPEAMKLLDELAEVLGQSKASLVAELIDSALPAIQATVNAMAVAAEQPREAQRLMSNYANQASMELSQQQLALDAAIDARTVKGKRTRRRANAST